MVAQRFLKNADGTVIALVPPRITIGREGCDLNLRHRGISLKHAVLHLENDVTRLEDQGSRNGTYLNDKQLDPSRPVEIHNGDFIQFSLSRVDRFEFCTGQKPEQNVPELLALLHSLNAHLDEREILQELLKLAVRAVRADRGFLLSREMISQGRGRPLAVWPEPNKSGTSLLELGILEEPVGLAAATRQRIFRNYTTDAEDSSTLAHSVLCLPVTLHDVERDVQRQLMTAKQSERDIGVLYLDCSSQPGGLEIEGQQLVQALADHAAMLVETLRRVGLEAKLQAASEIQRRLLPAGFDRWGAFDFCARNIPAEFVSGDFYEFIEITQNRLGIAIGDVTGHGVPAAVMMSGVMSSVWNIATNLGSPADVLRSANEYVCRRFPDGKIVTLLYGELHASGLFTWLSAGHFPPLIIRNDATVEAPSSEGGVVPLGTMPTSNWDPNEPVECWAQLNRGDLVVAFTDGIVEAPVGGGQFGVKRLKEHIATLEPALACRQVVDRIIARVRQESSLESFPDDVTLLAFRYTGAPEAAQAPTMPQGRVQDS